MFIPRFALSQLVSLALASIVSSAGGHAEEPTLEQRLAKLAETLEAARVEAHVPGMSIAIVKDDEIVWARGFGFADVEGEVAADENTIYAVGSTTKAFTATLVGMLADEGKLTWDDPVTEHLPYFDLQVRSDDENAECTLRDLLSHRHGFSRMGLLWFNNALTREEILRTAAGAEPWNDFREKFAYCNVTYLAAGEAAGAAAGSSWEELMSERIFEPLEMSSSTLTVAAIGDDPRLALGYEWNETDEIIERKPMIELDNIGPAGSVNSNVLDMARWLRLQLGRGTIDDMQLISEETLRETWRPQIPIGNGVSYGLGWMLLEQDGRQVVEHGGNIDGFSAQVGFMPEERLGYVLLMNLDAAPIQRSSLATVFDALFDEWPEEKAVTEAGTGELDLEEYVGLYIANFATFRDDELEVLIKDDHLALDVPGQQVFNMKLPDDEGKWPFVLTDAIQVSFQRDARGQIVGLTMHQSGFEFQVPRKGVESAPEVPAAELEKYTGTYAHAEGKRIEIAIRQGRLAILDRGNQLSFHTPDADGHAALRARPDQGATFDVDAEGNVGSLVFHGGAGDRLFTRVAEEQDTDLPTLEQILALRNTDARIARAKSGGIKSTGTIYVPQAGLHGTFAQYTRGDDRSAEHQDFGKYGRNDTVIRDGQAWVYTSMRGYDVPQGRQLTQVVLGHRNAVEGDWAAHFDTIEVVRNDTLDGRPVHVLRLDKGDLPSRTYYVDAELGDVLRVKQTFVQRTLRVPVTVNYYDFQEADGIRTPMRIESENPESGRVVMTFEKVERGLELGDDVFTLTDPD